MLAGKAKVCQVRKGEPPARACRVQSSLAKLGERGKRWPLPSPSRGDAVAPTGDGTSSHAGGEALFSKPQRAKHAKVSEHRLLLPPPLRHDELGKRDTKTQQQ